MNLMTLKFGLTSVLFSTVMITSPMCHAQVSEKLDQDIASLLQKQQDLAAGASVFEAMCASCHGKKLQGGMGFNLVDKEWIHGGRPSEIYTNISNGFANAGMPAFKAIYSPEQLKQVVAFILSKKQGWENVTYAIYPIDADKPADFSQIERIKPIKSGKAPNDSVDFSLSEITDYIITFEGDFYAPFEQPINLWFEVPRPVQVELSVDGTAIERKQSVYQPTFPIKSGKQHIKIMYTTAEKPKWVNNDISVLVTNETNEIKIAAASEAGNRFLNRNTFDVLVDKDPLVVRRQVLDIPPSSISVGLPSKINYAFNSKSCDIVAVWKGDLLNIGPNIGGRGQDPSLPLGDWAFKYPNVMTVTTEQPSNISSCSMSKYTRTGEPTIYFSKDGISYSLSGNATGTGITFNFDIVANPNNVKSLSINLPTIKNFTYVGDYTRISEGKIHIDLTKNKQFSVQLAQL